jgi:hypothetical protein
MLQKKSITDVKLSCLLNYRPSQLFTIMVSMMKIKHEYDKVLDNYFRQASVWVAGDNKCSLKINDKTDLEFYPGDVLNGIIEIENEGPLEVKSMYTTFPQIWIIIVRFYSEISCEIHGLAYFAIKKGIGHYGSYFENQEILLNSVIDVISGTTSECLLANFFPQYL